MNHSTIKYIQLFLARYREGVDGVQHTTLKDLISFSCGDEATNEFLSFVKSEAGIFTLKAEPGVVFDRIILVGSDTPEHLHG